MVRLIVRLRTAQHYAGQHFVLKSGRRGAGAHASAACLNYVVETKRRLALRTFHGERHPRATPDPFEMRGEEFASTPLQCTVSAVRLGNASRYRTPASSGMFGDVSMPSISFEKAIFLFSRNARGSKDSSAITP